jgi:adenosylhomocysteine nucleosidase
MIAVTFAVPQESKEFRHALRHAGGLGTEGPHFILGNLGPEEVLVAHTGIGPAAAEKTTAALLAYRRPRFLISTGFAGGLDPAPRVGDLIVAENFTDAQLRAKCRTLLAVEPGVFFGPLASRSGAAESELEKSALARQTGALAVDMETAAIAAECQRASVPLLAVRAISDTADQALPVPFSEWYDIAAQRPRPLALVSFLLRNPERIGPFARFLHGLAPARHTLTAFLLRFIAENPGA